MIHLWTDGACSQRGQKIGGWGFVAERDGAVLVEMAGWDRPATPNRMELLAVVHALRWQKRHHPGERVAIHTDSKYVYRQLRNPEHGYDPDGDHRKLRAVWRQLDRLLGFDVRPDIEWVPGHAGHRFNEAADRLAEQGQRGGTVYREGRPRKDRDRQKA